MRTFVRTILEIINLPALIRNLFRHRELIRTLAWRDFLAKYRGSFGGIFWAIVQPLLMMAIYTIVFSTFLKVRFGNSESPFTFSVFLLCGLLPWSAFSESFTASTTIIRGNTNLVKRVVFPLEILPLNLVLTSLIQQGIGFLLLLPLAFLVNGTLHSTLLYLPLLVLIEVILSSGLCWIWASLSVYLPDLRQFTGLLLSGLMFLMPLFYPREMIPANMSWLVDYNPFALLIEMFRKAFMTGDAITQRELLLSGGASLAVFLVGYFWFIKTKKGFADVL